MSQNVGLKTTCRNITLITKLNTTNVGNQALSNELIRLVKSRYTQDNLFFLSRPTGLEKYSLDKIQKENKNPIQIFDQWVEDIIHAYKLQYLTRETNNHFEQEGDTPEVHLIRLSDQAVRLEPAKRILRRFRRIIRNYETYGSSYFRRLSIINQSDIIVYNGAGEVGNNNIALRQLLELRIAQILGCQIVPVNQSILITDPTLSQILAYVYKDAIDIVVRGPMSQERLVQLGVAQSKIQIAPDTAILSEPADNSITEMIIRKESIKPQAVGITLAQFHGKDIVGWGKIIRKLENLGKQVIFISSDLFHDINVGKQLQAKYGIKILDREYDYAEYIGLISKLELIISGRLHTNIFAMLGNTPSVPLEGQHFRINDIFQVLKHPVKVVNMQDSNWSDEVIARVDYIYENYEEIKQNLSTRVRDLKITAQQNACWNLLTTNLDIV